MANKSFGTKQLDLTGASGSPIITSPSDLSINATTVAISTNISVGGYFSSNVNVGTGYSIGIGTTIPDHKIHVKADTATVARFERTGGAWAKVDIKAGSSSGNSYLTFSDSDATQVGAINYEHGDNSLRLNVNSAERIRIDSDGKVLVGVTTAEGSRNNTSTRYPFIQFSSAWDGGRGTGSFTCTDDYPILFINSNATYQDNAGAGTLTFSVKDGAGNYCNTAEIKSQIDGTPGNNDSPGDLTFLTTPDGSAQPVSALTVTARGDVICNKDASVSPAYFRPPHVTNAQMNALTGLTGGEMVYNTSENNIYWYDDNASLWKKVPV